MTDRAQAIAAFLAHSDWANATQQPLTSDASFRRYVRLSGGPTPALLMDAPPETNAPITPFLEISARLRAAGLSAPQVYAHDTALGLALIEDLGDALFARVLESDPTPEGDLYAAAADVLVHLHAEPISGLARYDAAMMGEMAGLAALWYAPDETAQTQIAAAMRDLAQTLTPDRFTQRDYHAENLLWLPDRTGLARVGLLDFQDAMAAPGPYDLVSLLSDARRDVAPEVITATRARYQRACGMDPQDFTRAYDICGAQRSLRILGVFARLWLRDGKPGYLPLIPRVWGQLHSHLAHPDLADLRTLVARYLPAPTDAVLRTIHARRKAAP